MRPEDAAGVEKVELASFAVPWSRQSFWEAAANDKTHYLLAVDGEEIIGYAGTWILGDEAQITNVAIAPEYRGKGVGKKLMAELIKASIERGAVRMTLEVRPSNAAAIALYTSFGFKDCGRRPGYYQDNGEDAIIMWNMNLAEVNADH
ncbi:MAG: ribosomal protein S18-alanine N-acetyltransferase [Schwartzia sp.]|nr:ribosomal protein S18-alanine N-acetyltransferase [Schwartzia sp. (in: firmicutes)]